MKTLNIQIKDEIHIHFRKYSISQERSMKGQLAWMVKETVKQYRYEEKEKEKKREEEKEEEKEKEKEKRIQKLGNDAADDAFRRMGPKDNEISQKENKA